MKQVTDTSKAILWWNNISEYQKIVAIAGDVKCSVQYATQIWNNCQGEITDEKILEIYLSEHPQPTDTGNTVSSEVAVVDFLNKKYRGKLVDNAVTLALSKQLLIDFYNETYTLHDALVSALKEAMDIIERMDTDINSSPTRTERKRLTDLLNNISNK